MRIWAGDLFTELVSCVDDLKIRPPKNGGAESSRGTGDAGYARPGSLEKEPHR